MRIAWFHCFSGIAGDMALGSLLDAGADLSEVRAALASLNVEGWALDMEATQRCGIGATRALVTTAETHHHRSFATIAKLLAASDLTERVRRRALATFRALAEVEGAIHGRPAESVEFHEVGSLDAIVDVVGVCAALESLGVDKVRASAVAVGNGTVRGAHGILPNPAPAVVALLEGAPVHGVDVRLELTTPTGAALLAGIGSGFGPMPAMTVERIGYGAGAGDLEQRPNVTQVVIGTDAAKVLGPGQPVALLEANVDDATGEALAHTVATLLAAGAHDAWITPIVMKKGRPAHTVSALCDPALAAQVGDALVRETGSLGLRGQILERWPQRRRDEIVDVDGEPVRVKIGAGRVKVEHDDAVAAAQRLGVAAREVVSRAEEAGRSGG